MEKINIHILTVALVAVASSIGTPSQAAASGFAYGIGFQNIPLNRLAYVTLGADRPVEPISSIERSTARQTITVAYAVSNEGSFEGFEGTKSYRQPTPKKDLLPLTGPRTN